MQMWSNQKSGSRKSKAKANILNIWQRVVDVRKRFDTRQVEKHQSGFIWQLQVNGLEEVSSDQVREENSFHGKSWNKTGLFIVESTQLIVADVVAFQLHQINIQSWI